MIKYKYRATKAEAHFFRGIDALRKFIPMYRDIFCDVYDLIDKECERDALFSLLDTIQTDDPGNITYNQRVYYIADSEVTYLAPDNSVLCWKRIGKKWVFWLLFNDDSYYILENADFNIDNII